MQRRTLMRTAAAGIGTVSLGGGALLAATGGGAAASGELTLDGVSIDDDAGELQYVDLAYWKRLNWTGFDTPVAAFDLTAEAEVPAGSGNVVELYTTTHTLGEPADGAEYVTDAFWGSADYHTGPGTSGTLGFAIGDAALPDDWAPGTSQQATSDRWTVVEGTAYAGNDPGAAYGLPETPYIDGEAGTNADPSVFNAPTDGESNSVDVTHRTRFKLRDADGNALTGEDGGDSDTAPFIPDPVLEDTYTVTVSNVASTDSTDGDGGAGGS